jgi:hypothetical protein
MFMRRLVEIHKEIVKKRKPGIKMFVTNIFIRAFKLADLLK